MPRKTSGPIPEGNVVQEFKIGNTRVKICDDYCRGQTREEAEAIMANFCRVCLPHLQKVELKKMQEAQAKEDEKNEVIN